MYKYKEGYEQIAREYKKNKSFEQISRELNVSGTKIKRALNYYGIESRTKAKKKYSINEYFFDRIDSEEKAYFLGLLHADGCNNGSGFYLKLQERDSEIIEKLKVSINYNGPIKLDISTNENYQNYKMINISSKYISKALNELGCVKNKTVNGFFPILDEQFIHHFIRGIFDGDGCITIDKRNQLSFTIVGNTKIMIKIKEYLKSQNIEVRITAPKRYKSDISIIASGGNKKCNVIYNFLYKDATIFLKRKKQKFQENERNKN